MSNIQPFRGIFYNQEKAGPLASVTAPPYDVISPDEADRFRRQSEFNVTRLTLPRGDDKYRSARDTFNRWREDKILVEDNSPSLYVYQQEYRYREKLLARTGIIALLELEEYGRGIVFPHEHILTAPKEDRLNLLRETGVNLELIFGLYTDEGREREKAVAESIRRQPWLSLADGEGTAHRLWRISEAGLIKKIQKEMQGKFIIIADGHHRYQAALSYHNERSSSGNHKEGSNFVMICLVAIDDPGLTILPTHRLVTEIDPGRQDEVIPRLSRFFHIKALDFKGETKFAKLKELFFEMQKEPISFGMYDGRDSYFLLNLKDRETLRHSGEKNRSPRWNQLAVSVLQSLIIKETLGIGEEEKENCLAYTHDENLAVKAVDEEKAVLAFFLNPTPITEVAEIARAGERLPQKSTYFYPKLLSGLVMRQL